MTVLAPPGCGRRRAGDARPGGGARRHGGPGRRPVRSLRGMQELVDRRLHLRGARDDVGDAADRGRRAVDVRLVDVVGVQRQRQREHPVELAQARDVGGDVVRDDAHHRQEPRQARELRRADQLALHLAQKDLLAHDAREVAVLVVAKAHPVERLRAVQALVAGVDVDRRVAGHRGVVVVAAIDHQVGSAEPVDDLLEAVEVDVDEVVDGHAEQLLDDLAARAWRRPASRRR